MNGRGVGGGGDPPPSNGGEFLLSLLQRPNQQLQPQLPTGSPLLPSPPPPRQQQQQQQQPPSLTDPAVAAMGPTLPFPHHVLWQSNVDRPDLVSPSWPQHSMPFPSTSPTPNLLTPGFPQNPWPAGPQSQGNQLNQQMLSSEDLFRLGFPSVNAQPKQQERGGVQKIQFGSMTESLLGLVNANPKVNTVQVQRVDSSSRGSFDSSTRELDRRKHRQGVRPPPGFSNKPQGEGSGGNRDYAAPHRKEFDHNVINKELSNGNASRRSGRGLTEQLDRPGPPAASNLHSVSASDVEESLLKLNLEGGVGEDGKEDNGVGGLDDVGEELVDSLMIEGESEDKKDKEQKRNFHDKESRSDSRGQRMLSQRMRMFKSQMRCRSDIERFNAPFLAIYESLIPLEEERAKQKQLLALLEKLVNKEWLEARLYLYGSCANSFGVSKSDIDVCLAIDEANIDKSEVLLKLADILQSDNLQNVQALTRARVPIVKLMDPVTGISCDICINNVLAVVNTKLLRDYAKIDPRLRQLAFIVKHWAKSRAVNETYQGTLSSYAYVLMCIHFLQQRRPAILPCLQGMETTYCVTVGDVQCSFFDQVEQIRGFGSHNRETIAHLVWGFFYYWAYRHDYTNDVISVRTGSIISKREKDWTRRVGNDRHLICIEDPFETSHDLGRVVDKFSIRVLREEFERAAEIMQYDANPCVTLFEPYIP